MSKKQYEYHPVLLPESRGHYDTNGQNNIIEFEQESTIEGGFGAISYNIIKYKNRKKGQDKLDKKKIETFEAWRELLKDLLEAGYQKTDNLRHAMRAEYPEMKYSLSREKTIPPAPSFEEWDDPEKRKIIQAYWNGEEIEFNYKLATKGWNTMRTGPRFDPDFELGDRHE